MWNTPSGDVIQITPGRRMAIISAAQRHREPAFLGVSLGRCRQCVFAAVGRRIARLARRARRAGTLRGDRGTTFVVFNSDGLGVNHRLVTQQLDDGRHTILAIDRRPAAAAPPVNLLELEEEEVRRGGLKADLVWKRAPLSWAQLRALQHVDAVYIMVDRATGNPLKVGITSNPLDRAEAYKNMPNVAFYVATLRNPIRTKNPGQVLPTIEHALTRAISRAALHQATTRGSTAPPGLDPKIHQRPQAPFVAGAKIQIVHALPPQLLSRYPLDAALRAARSGRRGFDAVQPRRAPGPGTLTIPRNTRFEVSQAA